MSVKRMEEWMNMDNDELDLFDEAFEIAIMEDAEDNQSGMTAPTSVFENVKKEVKKLLKKGFVPKIYNGFIELAGKTFNGITETLLNELRGN